MEAQCRKAYVSVNVDVDEEGTIHPCFIRWKDGLIFRGCPLVCRGGGGRGSGLLRLGPGRSGAGRQVQKKGQACAQGRHASVHLKPPSFPLCSLRYCPGVMPTYFLNTRK